MLRPNSVTSSSNRNLLMKQHQANKASNQSASRVDKTSLQEQFYS
jgi:hypothetical protein